MTWPFWRKSAGGSPKCGWAGTSPKFNWRNRLEFLNAPWNGWNRGGGNPIVQLHPRVSRVGLLERLDTLVPEPVPSPIEQLKLRGRQRQRASTTKAVNIVEKKWQWGDKP